MTGRPHLAMHAAEPGGSAILSLAGMRVLIVEDEALVGMHLQALLQGFGCETALLALHVGEAVDLVDRETFDLALLDVMIAGELVFPVAETLARNGVPFVFVTAFGADVIPEALRSRPLLRKPFNPRALRAALEHALDAAP